jgi:2-succinyl-5-enolpyruvyl-6-hydroxy-3-cyclohexene-1-carboxylate synthase
MPVAVLTTSGTAAAELLPAVIEAHYQGLPLIVITADRPRRFRGTGAPQVIEQVGLFGPYVSDCIDVEQGSNVAWPAKLADKPLHINLCLEEPLEMEEDGIDFFEHAVTRPLKSSKPPAFTLSGEPTVVIAAGMHPNEAREAAPILAKLKLPILAEATSNLWSLAFPEREALLPLLYPAAEHVYQSLQARQVLRIGSVPTSRWWRDLEKDPQIWVTNFTRTGLPGLARREHVQTLPWQALTNLAKLKLAPAVLSHELPPLDEWLAYYPESEPAWMREICQRIKGPSRVFLGNSLPIREFNMTLQSAAEPGHIEFYANRGANGIDGLVSTWLGVSASAPSSWLILGDLSTLYDLAALWVVPQLPWAARRLVVINNYGGKIFSRLPSMKELSADAHQLIQNEHRVHFSGWAKMWGLPYLMVKKATDLDHLPKGPVVLEVEPDLMQTEAFYAAMQA